MQQGIQKYQISQFEQAFQSWQQALNIYREIKDRLGEGKALGNLGLAYDSLGKYDKAIELQLQSLAIAREIKYLSEEDASLSNLGGVLSQSKPSELAILFYKQSINVREAICKDIRKLSHFN